MEKAPKTGHIMNIQEYENIGRKLYEEFSNVVKNSLENVIKGNETKFTRLPLVIQSRAKTVESLKKKLEKLELSDYENIEEKIKDLAGCRIIFYHNRDVKIFNSFDIQKELKEKFNVIVIDYKLLYKKSVPTIAELYVGDHYIVQLKNTDPKFQNLKCEIQIHTILNHVWSEAAHNTIYKPLTTPDFGQNIQQRMEENFKKLMIEHIRPAGHDLESILYDYESLVAGRKSLNTSIEEIKVATNNNERYQILNRFEEYVIPEHSNISQLSNIAIKLVKTTLSAKNIKETVPIPTPYGNLPGKTYEDILLKCIKILTNTNIFFPNMPEIFDYIVQLYVKNSECKIKIENLIKDVSNYKLSVLKNIGIEIQEYLISTIKNYEDKFLFSIKGLICSICRSVLSLKIQEFSRSDHETIQMTIGIIPAGNQSKLVREEALAILEKIYLQAESISEKKAILDIMTSASERLRINTDTLKDMISKESQRILDFFKSILAKENMMIIEKIECDTYWKYYYHGIDEETKKKALEIESILNALREYLIFKYIAGEDGIFKNWGSENNDDNKNNYEEKNEKRKERIKEYSKSINTENYHEWEKRIISYIEMDSDQLSKSYFFGKFLYYFGEASPRLALQFIKSNLEKIENFLHYLMLGIEITEKRAELESLQNNWIQEGTHLSQVAHFFEYSKNTNLKLLENILEKAKIFQNKKALRQLVATIIHKYNQEDKEKQKSLLISTVKELINLNDPAWIDLNIPIKNNIFADLSDEGITLILESLLPIDSFNPHQELILKDIADNFGALVIDFFEKRIKYDKKIDGYDAIPSSLIYLQEPLSKIPDIILEKISTWYKDYYSFQFSGATLIHCIFPNSLKPIESGLNKLIKTGAEQNINVALAILYHYHNEACAWTICKEIIKLLPQDSESLTKVKIILENNGVTEGYFGRADALKEKKSKIEKWKDDENEKVRLFSKQFDQELETEIAQEERNAEQDVEMRKHQFGDNKKKTAP